MNISVPFSLFLFCGACCASLDIVETQKKIDNFINATDSRTENSYMMVTNEIIKVINILSTKLRNQSGASVDDSCDESGVFESYCCFYEELYDLSKDGEVGKNLDYARQFDEMDSQVLKLH
jgi:hypothetical protein